MSQEFLRPYTLLLAFCWFSTIVRGSDDVVDLTKDEDEDVITLSDDDDDIIELTKAECDKQEDQDRLEFQLFCTAGKEKYLVFRDKAADNIHVHCKLEGDLGDKYYKCTQDVINAIKKTVPWRSCSKSCVKNRARDIALCESSSGEIILYKKNDPGSCTCPSPTLLPTCSKVTGNDGKPGQSSQEGKQGQSLQETDSETTLQCTGTVSKYELCREVDNDSPDLFVLDEDTEEVCKVRSDDRSTIESCVSEDIESILIDLEEDPTGTVFSCPRKAGKPPSYQVRPVIIKKREVVGCKVFTDEPSFKNRFFSCLPENAADEGYQLCTDKEQHAQDELYMYNRDANFLCIIPPDYHDIAKTCPLDDVATAINEGNPTPSCSSTASSAQKESFTSDFCRSKDGRLSPARSSKCSQPSSSSKAVPTCSYNNLPEHKLPISKRKSKLSLEGQFQTSGQLPAASSPKYRRIQDATLELLTVSTPFGSTVQNVTVKRKRGRPHKGRREVQEEISNMVRRQAKAEKAGIVVRRQTEEAGILVEFAVEVPRVDSSGRAFGVKQLAENLKENADTFDAGEEFKIDVESIQVKEGGDTASPSVFQPLPIMAAAAITAFLLVGIILIIVKCLPNMRGVISKRNGKNYTQYTQASGAPFLPSSRYNCSYDPENPATKSVCHVKTARRSYLKPQGRLMIQTGPKSSSKQLS